MKFQHFDYGRPPVEGLYWLAYEAVLFDVDSDDYGDTIGAPTGEMRPSIAMAMLEHQQNCGLPFSLTAVDRELNVVDEVDPIRAYCAVVVPSPIAAADTGQAEGFVDAGQGHPYHGYCWVSFSLPGRDEERLIALAFRWLADDGDGIYEQLSGATPWTSEFEDGAMVHHFLPLAIPPYPAAVEAPSAGAPGS